MPFIPGHLGIATPAFGQDTLPNLMPEAISDPVGELSDWLSGVLCACALHVCHVYLAFFIDVPM